MGFISAKNAQSKNLFRTNSQCPNLNKRWICGVSGDFTCWIYLLGLKKFAFP